MQRLNDWLFLNGEDDLDEENEDHDHDRDDEKMEGGLSCAFQRLDDRIRLVPNSSFKSSQVKASLTFLSLFFKLMMMMSNEDELFRCL